ncbi:MAG: helix-turn-helix domain-containing protein [Candidatus Caccovivens sp.]
MSNFQELLNDVIFEQGKNIEDLFEAKIISKENYYKFKTYNPFLPTLISIANFLEVSIDYLAGRESQNHFRKYKNSQTNFFEKLNNTLKALGVSQSKLAREIHIDQSNFSHWKNGAFPCFSTLVLMADYLKCSIDEFLDLEC